MLSADQEILSIFAQCGPEHLKHFCLVFSLCQLRKSHHYGGSWFPEPQNPHGPRVPFSARPMGNRSTVPTINLNESASSSQSISVAGNMLSNIAHTFQATLGTLAEANINAQHQQAQVIAQTVATAVQNTAQQFQNSATEARERLSLIHI